MTQHWRCECGAWGHSTAPEVQWMLIDNHRRDGHVVTIWSRGKRDEAVELPALREADK